MPSGTLEQLPEWATALLESARVAHLGLLDGDGRPRVLPVAYAICEEAAFTVIDQKPKREPGAPARVRWLSSRPSAALTVDRYSDDWSELRWVQLLGEMTVLDGRPTGPGMAALEARYPQYVSARPPGPLLRLAITRALWWNAA